MTYKKVKASITKNKKQHLSFIGRNGHILMGVIAGWSLAHWFVHYAGGTWPHDVFIGEALLEVINKLGGLTAVVSAVIAIYTVYKKKEQAK